MRTPKKMQMVAVRPMLPGNHIKVMQSLNAAFCLQSGASAIRATEMPVRLLKQISKQNQASRWQSSTIKSSGRIL